MKKGKLVLKIVFFWAYGLYVLFKILFPHKLHERRRTIEEIEDEYINACDKITRSKTPTWGAKIVINFRTWRYKRMIRDFYLNIDRPDDIWPEYEDPAADPEPAPQETPGAEYIKNDRNQLFKHTGNVRIYRAQRGRRG